MALPSKGSHRMQACAFRAGFLGSGMSAPNMTVASPGQIQGSGDPRALYLKLFAGEVLGAFTEANKAMERSIVRTITKGKSAQFPSTWKAAASYHTPGQMITGQSIQSNERVITIDDLLISPVFIANIDEALSQYEFRAEYSKQCGLSLAYAMDKHILQVAVLAARVGTPAFTGGPTGATITDASAKTNADAFVADCFAAAAVLDKNNVPEGDRAVFVTPDIYYMLVNSSSKAIHRDYNAAQDNGRVADGTIMKIAGLEIVKTNHLPQTDLSASYEADGSTATSYAGNFTNTAAVVFHRSAVGTVKLVDLAVESDYLIQNQGTLVVAKLAVGHGILRPEAAIEIKTA